MIRGSKKLTERLTDPKLRNIFFLQTDTVLIILILIGITAARLVTIAAAANTTHDTSKVSSSVTSLSSSAPPETSGPSASSPVPSGSNPAASAPPPSQASSAPGNATQTDFSYFDDAVFIGDSLIVDITNYESMKNTTVVAAIGASTYTAYNNHNIEINADSNTHGWIPQLAAAKHPKKIYMMFGSNDLGWMSKSQYIDYYGRLVGYLQSSCPGVEIYVQSILPIAAKVEDTPGENGWPFDNAKIDDYNAALKDMCASRNLKYLDVASVMKGPDGKLPPSVTDDGVHLKSSEYKKWFNYLLANK